MAASKSWLMPIDNSRNRSAGAPPAISSSRNPRSRANQGRVTLPQRALDQAGIKEQVMLVGLADRLEVWSSDALDDLTKAKKDQIRRGLEALFERELAAPGTNALGSATGGSGEGSSSTD